MIPRHVNNVDWMHKVMNVLNCLPKYGVPGEGETGPALDLARPRRSADAEKAFGTCSLKPTEPKYPKATLCLQKD